MKSILIGLAIAMMLIMTSCRFFGRLLPSNNEYSDLFNNEFRPEKLNLISDILSNPIDIKKIVENNNFSDSTHELKLVLWEPDDTKKIKYDYQNGFSINEEWSGYCDSIACHDICIKPKVAVSNDWRTITFIFYKQNNKWILSKAKYISCITPILK